MDNDIGPENGEGRVPIPANAQEKPHPSSSSHQDNRPEQQPPWWYRLMGTAVLLVVVPMSVIKPEFFRTVQAEVQRYGGNAAHRVSAHPVSV